MQAVCVQYATDAWGGFEALEQYPDGFSLRRDGGPCWPQPTHAHGCDVDTND